jgi:hypothetical protein
MLTFADFSLPTPRRGQSHAQGSREALGRASYERDRDEVLLGRAIDADAKGGDAFAKLARYERSLERSLL